MGDEEIGTSHAPERESPIMDGMNAIHRQAAALREKLRVVLKPGEPAQGDNKPPESATVLGKINSIGQILQEIDERLLV